MKTGRWESSEVSGKIHSLTLINCFGRVSLQ